MQERSSQQWVDSLQPEEALTMARALQSGSPAAQALCGQLTSLASRLAAQQTLLQRTTTMALAAAQVHVRCLLGFVHLFCMLTYAKHACLAPTVCVLGGNAVHAAPSAQCNPTLHLRVNAAGLLMSCGSAALCTSLDPGTWLLDLQR